MGGPQGPLARATRGRDGGWRPRRSSWVKHLARAGGLAVVLVTLVATGLVAYAALTPLPKQEVAQATVLYDVQGRVITSLYRQNRQVASPEELPQALRQAVVAAEDARFYQHPGIDPVALVRATARNVQAGRIVEGGSSITQQLARTLYGLSLERTLGRKLEEALLAIKLETHYTKDQILTMYLNQVYLGRGAYGVKVAAQEYFGKPVSSLSLAESATLAAFIRGPEIYWRDPDRARARRNWVLGRMAELGMISATQAWAAQREPLVLRPPEPRDRPAPYFVDYVQEQVAQRWPDLAADLPTGGYQIYTTLDLDMQQAAERAVALLDQLVAPLPAQDGVPQPQVALVALDPDTGGIRAMVGGRDYHSSRYNRVLARRQPGSAFKPFLYTAVLADGEPITTPIACQARSYPGGQGRDPYEPHDYGSRPYHDAYFDVRRAVAISDNLVAVEWMNRVKPRRVIQLARQMGIESPLKDQLGLALGASDVTPLELTVGYATLANLGRRTEPVAIRKIVDSQGKVLFQQQPEPQRVLSPEVAWLMTDVLTSVFDPTYDGTARGLSIGRPVAGKTGTTDQSHDLWFVGYTPDLVATVWVGSDQPQPVHLPNGAGATGSSTAGRIWQAFMTAALADTPARPFPRPPGVVRAPACTLTGPVTAPRFEGRDEWFLAGHVPEANCVALLPRIGAPQGPLPLPLPQEGPPDLPRRGPESPWERLLPPLFPVPPAQEPDGQDRPPGPLDAPSASPPAEPPAATDAPEEAGDAPREAGTDVPGETGPHPPQDPATRPLEE